VHESAHSFGLKDYDKEKDPVSDGPIMVDDMFLYADDPGKVEALQFHQSGLRKIIRCPYPAKAGRYSYEPPDQGG
jgi:hypothetical protein